MVRVRAAGTAGGCGRARNARFAQRPDEAGDGPARPGWLGATPAGAAGGRGRARNATFAQGPYEPWSGSAGPGWSGATPAGAAGGRGRARNAIFAQGPYDPWSGSAGPGWSGSGPAGAVGGRGGARNAILAQGPYEAGDGPARPGSVCSRGRVATTDAHLWGGPTNRAAMSCTVSPAGAAGVRMQPRSGGHDGPSPRGGPTNRAAMPYNVRRRWCGGRTPHPDRCATRPPACGRGVRHAMRRTTPCRACHRATTPVVELGGGMWWPA
jgi:hypothetical protein